ncbi:hypothetical protein HY030_04285 [Candidatus Gottesmanbacteria bacterium]|nr:hypothetical protein [Candidatus Gottesmanbacteria bacterium]
MNNEWAVYKEFFTSAAVAWFSAGIIAPLFTKTLGFKEITSSIVSVISCLIFLKIAILIVEKEKQYESR